MNTYIKQNIKIRNESKVAKSDIPKDQEDEVNKKGSRFDNTCLILAVEIIAKWKYGSCVASVPIFKRSWYLDPYEKCANV